MGPHDNRIIAELARQQSIETRSKVYAIDEHGVDAVYINGELKRWTYIDDVEVVYADEDAATWQQFLHGTKH